MWLFILSVLTAHAGGGAGLTVRIAVPAQQVLSGVKTLQVAPLSGSNGAQIAMEVRTALADPDRVSADSGAYGRALLGDVTEIGAELASAAVGGGIAGNAVGSLTRMAGSLAADATENEPLRIDDGMRIDVFQLVESGADATLGGRVSVASADRSYTIQMAKTDGNGNIVKDANGKTVSVDVPCKERTATVELAWSVTGAATAQGNLVRKGSDSKCGSEMSTLATAESLAQPLLVDWGPMVAGQIAPSWTIVRLGLMRDKDLREDLQLARADSIMPAICNLRGLVAFDEYYVPAIFNMGVFLEALGHLPEAEQQYQRALAVKQEKQVGKALVRVQARQRATTAMTEAYGLTYTVGPADYATCPVLPDGRRLILKKETPLYADAGSIAPTTVLPKGMKVWVTAEGSPRGEVSTMDGKKGFIDEKLLK